jgi:hypothetical protein
MWREEVVAQELYIGSCKSTLGIILCKQAYFQQIKKDFSTARANNIA